MKLGEVLEFRKDLYFEGAVQADWFYDPEKASKVAENFVFHGKNYYGVEAKRDSIDTISLVKTLVGKLGKEDSNPRTLAIADYGTGKSHLAVTLGQIFSGASYMPETYEKILHNIEKIDPESASDIRRLSKDKNFVIMLNGIRDFNLHSEILKATQKSLKLYGIDDTELKKLNRTIETANRFFELNAINRLHDFEVAAARRGWGEMGECLIDKIKDSLGSDDIAFEIINDVYEMTTGQRIRWEEGISAKVILEMLLNKFCGLNGQFDNVVVLFDEFGRYLEYASGTDAAKSGDNALQEIFEVSQNAAGTLQIIDFIQDEIKAYLDRVDQSRNLSRYIGRYAESETFHISSNLETVFANLISRNNVDAFRDRIVNWLNSKEENWKIIYDALNKWTRTSGIWADYTKFRKVIVEGIYPIHPIAVFMLTQLSDYLQNRSSLTIVSRFISDLSDVELDKSIPYILPTTLMHGDFYIEMLAAETSGRHRSDLCIRYDNILKKNEAKFDDLTKTVLRANLITRTLRFNTRSYDEAKESLALCSGLPIEKIEDALHILVDEYAVMAFDEMSGCFDFTEDAKGAYDYKIMKRRLFSTTKVDIRNLFSTASILEVGGFLQNQLTNFNTVHKITTNEWCFTQEVMLAEDLTSNIAEKYIKNWDSSRSVVVPKGRLIWLYLNKDSDYHIIERLQSIAQKFVNTPIVMLLLNDVDNKLQNILTEYEVLDHMDAKTRDAYNMIYIKDRERVLDNLKNAFEALKKQREQITANGTIALEKRLPSALTEIFEKLYPKIVSFNFDGLLTQGNNFTGNGIKNYCQILKMFLSNKVNEDTIHDFQIDIRNRIQALFMIDGSASWKCITSEYAIISPLNKSARSIYDMVEAELNKNESYNCATFFDTYCAPPYGLSEEAATMFLAMIITNLWHNIRVEYNNVRTTVIEWKDHIVEDKKIHIDQLKMTTLLWVDTGSVESKFSQLFKKIESNKDISESKKLEKELSSLIEFYGLPESMEVHKRLADLQFEKFRKAETIWLRRVEDIETELDESEEKANVNKTLNAIEMINNLSIAEIFTNNGIIVSEEYKTQPAVLLKRADTLVKANFKNWLDQSVYCKSIDQMNTFEKFYQRCAGSLLRFGYPDFSKLVTAKGEKELRNKAEIKSRQELVDDGNKFLKSYKNMKSNDYLEAKKLLKDSVELQSRFEKYVAGLGKEALIVGKQVNIATEKLTAHKKKMDDDIASVFDIVAEADSLDSLELASECLNTVLTYTMAENDRKEFIDLQNKIVSLQADIKEIESYSNNRKEFEKVAEQFRDKYSNENQDYDFIPVIEDCIAKTKEKIDQKDIAWRTRYLTLGSRSRQDVYAWKENIKMLPAFLSEATKNDILKLDVEAEQIISNGKIEDVLQYFNKLTIDERKKCVCILNDSVAKDNMDTKKISDTGVFDKVNFEIMSDKEIIEYADTNRESLSNKEMTQIYTILIARNCSEIEYYLMRGRYYLYDGEYEKAMNDIKHSLILDPRNSSAHAWKAIILQGVQDGKVALKELDYAYSLDPQNQDVVTGYAKYYCGNNMSSEAIPWVKKRLTFKANDSNAFIALLCCLVNTKQYKEILQLTEKHNFQFSDEEKGKFHLVRAIAYYNQEDDDLTRSREEIALAVKFCPNDENIQSFNKFLN